MPTYASADQMYANVYHQASMALSRILGSELHDETDGGSGLVEDIDILGRQRDTARSILADRERELLNLKGPCRTPGCRLHRAHVGPCDIKATQPVTFAQDQAEGGDRG